MSVAQLGPVRVPESASPPQEITNQPAISPPKALVLYAGFWLRAVAYIIDTVLISIVFAFLASFNPTAFIKFPDPNAQSYAAIPQVTFLALVISFPIVWIYYAVFETSSWQGTPGKRVMHLYVTDMNGQPLTFARASIRYFGKMLSGFTFLIGYFIAGFTEKKQALHDLIAGCLVLRRP